MISIVQIDDAESPELIGKYALRNDFTGYYLPNDENTAEAVFDTVEEAEAFGVQRLQGLQELINSILSERTEK